MVISKQKIIKAMPIIFSIVLLDQLIKHIILFFQPNIDLWILKIVLLKNTGMAFSLFTGYNIFLMFISFVFVISAFCFYDYLSKELGDLAVILIISGAISNLIDRVLLGYVIDMISIWKFPVFNLADSLITIGAMLIIIKYVNEEIMNKKLN